MVLSVVVVSSNWISETDSSVVPDEQVIKIKHNKVSKKSSHRLLDYMYSIIYKNNRRNFD